MKPVIVISAVNIVSGGTASILKECLKHVSQNLSDDFRIIAIVNNNDIAFFNNIEYLEYPLSKKSWFLRVFYEYCYFKKISRKIKPYLWLSLHDMTPTVKAEIRAVYCHSPAPFYKHKNINTLRFSPNVFVTSLFYKYLYRINIKKNNFVIVQQQWLREKFSEMYSIKESKIVVARPVSANSPDNIEVGNTEKNQNYQFFYPSLPRVFKNFEVILEAISLLEKANIENFEVSLTIDGSENRYSRYLVKKYKYLKQVKFIGLQNKAEMEKHYQQCDCLIFPSTLETWGLPISEFAIYKKPMLIADLEYAHETAANSECTAFFHPSDAKQLSQLMKQMMHGDTHSLHKQEKLILAQPATSSWTELFNLLLKN
jgi:glycosyltransferase involved in cell wall biosynthesis